MVMEAHDDPKFRDLVNGADLVVPDGMPLVWALRRQGLPWVDRIYGPDLMLEACFLASRRGILVGLYGSTPEVLRRLATNLQERYPGLIIAYAFSPPFRALTPEEDAEILEDLRRSGIGLLFVGLGCPRQETWMAQRRGQVPAVMLGVGAAFDFHAGTLPQAPGWMQRAGLEWLFRFKQEPRRLWKRYLKHNTRFLALLGWQLWRRR
jgi:N-acetylglucosaminyldiphosphoundecaprenol N-acetyl-beta-D-mannosaminyltransferase